MIYCIVENGKVVNRITANSQSDAEINLGVNQEAIEHDVAQIGWDYDGTVFTAPPLPVPVLPDEIQRLKDDVTSLRFEKETGGIIVSGTSISTDRTAQAMITGALGYSQQNPAALIDWKAADGWTQINNATIIAIASAVGLHVQNCFSNERSHHEAIDQLTTLAEVESYDINVGW